MKIKKKNYFVQILRLKGSLSLKSEIIDGDSCKNIETKISILFCFLKRFVQKKIKGHVYIFLILLSFSALDSYQMNVTSSLFNA